MSKLSKTVVNNETLQMALTLIIWTTICILYIMERTVPDSLLATGSIVIGFYFHNAAQKQLMKAEAKCQSSE